MDVKVYTNFDRGASIVDENPTFGYCTLIGGNLVTRRSKMQPMVALRGTPKLSSCVG